MITQLYLFTLPDIKPDPVQQAQIDLEPYRAQAKQAGYKPGFIHVWARKQSPKTALIVYQLLMITTENDRTKYDRFRKLLKSAIDEFKKMGAA